MRVGRGKPSVIVHGSLASGESGLPVARLLANRFTCFVMDRRSYGRRGDSPNYAIEREYEDIEAVLAAAGEEVSLPRHSYGAICALGAATRTEITRLALYEPPLAVSGSVTGGALGDYRKAIESGDLDGALALGLNKFAGVTSDQVQALRSSPFWPKMTSLAPSWVREVEAIEELGSSLDRYRDLLIPTLLLSGTLSPKYPLQDATEAFGATLKHVQISRLKARVTMLTLAPPR